MSTKESHYNNTLYGENLGVKQVLMSQIGGLVTEILK